MGLTLRDYRLYVSQCAVLEQSLMYYDLEHKNVIYCDGTNLKDRLQDKNTNNGSNENTSIIDLAVADLAIVD